MIQISKFVFFNTVLPSLDIGTDINAFLVYLALNDDDLDHYHPKWAVLTISWVFARVPLISQNVPEGLHNGFLGAILCQSHPKKNSDFYLHF